MRRVIITGGSGLIGSHLSTLLAGEGWQVAHLTRGDGKGGRYKSFRWDPETGYCDREAFREGDAIIHLAGSNIGQGRWTAVTQEGDYPQPYRHGRAPEQDDSRIGHHSLCIYNSLGRKLLRISDLGKNLYLNPTLQQRISWGRHAGSGRLRKPVHRGRSEGCQGENCRGAGPSRVRT